MKMLSFALIGVTIWNYARIQTPKKLHVNIKGRMPWCQPGNAARKFQEFFVGQNGGVTQE